MRPRTGRLLAITAVFVAVIGAFVAWDWMRGGLKVTVVNRTSERYALSVFDSDRGGVDVEVGPGESRMVRLGASDPARSKGGRSFGARLRGVGSGRVPMEVEVGVPERWGLVEIEPLPSVRDAHEKPAEGHDRRCVVTTGAPIRWNDTRRRILALRNPLRVQTSATRTFRADPGAQGRRP